jgi:hypothetical protein
MDISLLPHSLRDFHLAQILKNLTSYHLLRDSRRVVLLGRRRACRRSISIGGCVVGLPLWWRVALRWWSVRIGIGISLLGGRVAWWWGVSVSLLLRVLAWIHVCCGGRGERKGKRKGTSGPSCGVGSFCSHT